MQETTTTPIEQIETTDRLFKIVEDGEIFDPFGSVNQMPGKYLSVENIFDTDDGVFPRINEWTKLVNAIDHEGASAFLNWLGKGKLKFDTGYITIEREGKFTDKATIYFEKPIKMIMGYLNDKPVIVEVDKIMGEFTYEWGWWKNGRQNKVANSVELWFQCNRFYNTKEGQ